MRVSLEKTLAQLQHGSHPVRPEPVAGNAVHCDNAIIDIDPSAAKRALHGVAIGQRNYLFAGTNSGGERAEPSVH